MGVEYIAPTWPIRQRGYLTATLKASTDIIKKKTSGQPRARGHPETQETHPPTLPV